MRARVPPLLPRVGFRSTLPGELNEDEGRC